ncbi:hypothetical protein DSL72_003107 [Monilinia vaccinii-corymbosi]|uniref:Uncharacterized protein n=1 Tax=Monilinia vaccinii-corymbosi TaxID=61207 RepID=A0A8A3P5A1_9HELO|nr:hypothetical protein DSL72_003107 [Monilinia vaccinii-corymbosi]
MRFLDLTKLIGSQAMTLPCILSKNGYSFRSSALLDSGANGYAFIDTTLLTLLFHLFKPRYQLLENSIGVKGYNSAQGRAITHYTFLNLLIDSRKQSFVPFLITDLGFYSIILNKSWLSESQTKLDCFNRRLEWPSERPLTYSLSRNLLISKSDLKQKKINRFAQQDADRRDKKLDAYWHRRDAQLLSTTISTIQPSDPLSAKKSDPPPQLELKKLHITKPPGLYKLLLHFLSDTVDIYAFTLAQFEFSCKRYKHNELFTATFADFDAAIRERQQEENKKDQLLVVINAYQHTGSYIRLNNVLAAADEEPPIPPAYQVFHKAFSKDKSNVLFPYYLYNHKIILEEKKKKTLKYNPFYKISLKQLKVVKEYFINNLAKRFIKLN